MNRNLQADRQTVLHVLPVSVCVSSSPLECLIFLLSKFNADFLFKSV